MKHKISQPSQNSSQDTKMLYVVFVIVLWFITFMMNAQVKTTTVSGNWNNPAIWSPYGVPNSSNKIFIDHSVTLNQNFSPSDTIFVRNVLKIGSNSVLTLSTGIMVLVNNASYDGRLGTVGSNGNIVGDFIFQKWINRCDGYSNYGSPFDVFINDFSWYYCHQCMPNWSNLYFYDETVAGSMDQGYYDNINGVIPRGRGFFYWYNNYTGGPNFSRKISLKGNINFLNDFNFNISRTVSAGPADDGYNLLANPFPGTIDWLSGDWTKKKIVDAIYVWNTCSGNYSSYSGGVGVNGGSRYIPSMQGFWVHADKSNPELTVGSGAMTSFTHSLMKTSSPEEEVMQVLRLSMNDDEIAVRLDPEASSALDSVMDAPKYFSDNSSICSSVKSQTTEFSINAVKDSNVVISIKTKGQGKITVSGLNTFSPVYSIKIKDLQNNQFLAVSEGAQFDVSGTNPEIFETTFELYFSRQTATGIKNEFENSASVHYDQENIFMELSDAGQLPATVSLYDLSGRLLYSGNMDQTKMTLPRPGVPSLIRVNNRNGSLSKKIF